MIERYYIGVTSGPLQQGDLFSALPFPVIRLDEFSYLDGEVVKLGNLQRRKIPPQGDCVLGYEASWGIIVSQTCDLQPRPNKEALPISFARVSLFSQLKILTDKKPSNRNSLIVEMANERGRHPGLFPLAAYNSKALSFEGGVATLHTIMSVPYAKGLARRRRLRLSQLSLQSFQERLGGNYLRTALPDKDKLELFLNLSTAESQTS